MIKKVALLLCMLCILLVSCSVASEPKLCHVSFAGEVESSKALTASIAETHPTTFSYFVRIPSTGAPNASYASINLDTWYPESALTSVVLSQGKWTFEAAAVEASAANTNLSSNDVDRLAVLLGEKQEYLNLNTSVISIPLTEYASGKGTINFTYELAADSGYNVASSLLIPHNGTSFAETGSAIDVGENANIPAGKYLLYIVVKDNNTPSSEIFHDAVVLSVYQGCTTNVTGKFLEERAPSIITSQTDPTGTTGLKEALDWADTHHEETVSVILGADISCTPNSEQAAGKPIFEIPDCVKDVQIDMAGKDFKLPTGNNSLMTTFFHVDQGVTLSLGNSANGDQANLITGNKGSAIGMDGGSLKLWETGVDMSNGNDTIGSINFVGCAGNMGENRGGSVLLDHSSYLQKAAYGISNLVPSNGTKSASEITGDVNVSVDNNSQIAGTGYGVYLQKVTGNIHIKADHSSTITGPSQGIYLNTVNGNVNIDVSNSSGISATNSYGIALSNINGDVTITIDGGTISTTSGAYAIRLASMTAGKTLKVVLKNGASMAAKTTLVKVECNNINLVLEYDSTCPTTLVNNTAFSGWEKRQI